MSTINKGYTFSTGPSPACNYTALAALMASALVTSIPLSEFASSSRVHQISATTPGSDQGDGATWYDTTLGTYRQKGVAGWYKTLEPEMENQTGSTLPQGMWVVNSGSYRVAMGATHRWPEVLGVLIATLTNTSKGFVATSGIARALVVGPCTAGDYLVLAGEGYTSGSTAGYAVSATLGPSGNLLCTLGIERGIALGNMSAGVSGLMTCIIFG